MKYERERGALVAVEIVGVVERHMGNEGQLKKEIEGRVIYRWRRIRRFKEVRDKGMARDKDMD